MYRNATLFRRSALRVAFRYAQMGLHKEAKPKHLKAIDFTIGLIRDFNKRGLKISADPKVQNKELLRRLIQMRKMVQKGFDLDVLLENDEILSGKGKRIVKRIRELESQSQKAQLKGKELKAFMKTYPDKEDGARRLQADFFRQLIIKELSPTNEQKEDMDYLVQDDFDFYKKAYGVVVKFVKDQMGVVSGTLGSAGGTFQIREKKLDSTWKKSQKKKVPFYMLGDLLGCRSILSSMPAMAAACEIAQSKMKVVAKDNKYLDQGIRYNAVHYAFSVNKLVVEYQVKAEVSHFEASLTHELLHAGKFMPHFNPEGDPDGPQPPSAGERKMIETVIDISSQLGLQEMESYFEMGLQSTEADEDDDFLYGGNLTEDELRDRVRMAYARRIHARRMAMRRIAHLHRRSS